VENNVSNSKMVINVGNLRFEKYIKGNIVNIYVEDREIECFTDYSIGSDFGKFEDSCKEYYAYMQGL
jgi:hypothetical protein